MPRIRQSVKDDTPKNDSEDIQTQEEACLIASCSELAQQEGLVQRTIKLKLNSLMQDKYASRLKPTITSLVERANILVAEAYALANHHIIRLLATQSDLPKIDRNFYYRCLVALSDMKPCAKTMSANFLETVCLFNAHRPPQAPSRIAMVGEVQLLADLSIMMASMAKNHLFLNLERRVLAYVRWRYPHLKGLWTGIAKAVAWKGVPDLEKLIPSRPQEEGSTRAVRAQEARNVSIALRAKIGPGFKDTYTTVHQVLPLYFDILRETECEVKLRKSSDGPKRAAGKPARMKLFSMLPTKQGYTANYIPLSSMTLMRLLKVTGLEPSIKDDGRHEDHDSLWRKYFAVRVIETKKTKFAYRVLTDGYGASALMSGAESTRPRQWDGQAAFCDADAVLQVAIDPGFTDVVTALDSTGKVWSHSSAQFYHDAHYHRSARSTKMWTEQTKDATQAIPTANTGNLQQHALYLSSYLLHLAYLLQHRFFKGFRKMRFLRYCSRKHAISKLCDKIAPPALESVVVGFGDWDGGARSAISRKTCGPLREMKLELSRRKNVVFCLLDEHNTSQKCSCCGSQLHNMKANTTKTVPSGEKVTRYGKVHKVLHCKNSVKGSTNSCGKTWDRDVNAARNLFKVLSAMLKGEARPAYLERQQLRKSKQSLKRGKKGEGKADVRS